MGGDEIIERVKEVIKFIKSDDNDKAVLYLNYIIEDIEMYKNNFNNSEKKIIKDVFKSKGFKVVSISDYEVEWDNDRSYKPSINFILNKQI